MKGLAGLLAAALLALGSSAGAQAWTPAEVAPGGETAFYRFTAATDSGSLSLAKECRAIVYGFDPDIGGNNTTATADLVACPTGSAPLSACQKIADLEGDVPGLPANPAYRNLRCDVVNAPSGGLTAACTVACAAQTSGLGDGGGGGGGGASSASDLTYVPSDASAWLICSNTPLLFVDDYLDCLIEESAKNDELVIVTEGTGPPAGTCDTPNGQPCMEFQVESGAVAGLWAGADGGAFTLIGPGAGSPAEVFIDVTGVDAADLCSTIQATINPFLTATGVHHLRIIGTGSIGFSDLHFAKYHNVGVGPTNGPFKTCVTMQPSRGANGGVSAGYPISNASDINNPGTLGADLLSITWDLHLTYVATGQNVPVVLFWAGGGFFDGPLTALFDGVVQRGVIEIILPTENDGGTVRGAMPIMHADTLFADPQTTVGFFNSSNLRGDESQLSKRVLCNAADGDDIGLVHQFAWGTTYGSPRALSCNVGMVYYGSSGGTLNEPYFNNNAIGLAAGSDNVVGGNVVYFSDCIPGGANCATLDESTTSVKVRGGVIEGNAHNNIFIMDAEGWVIDGTQTEISSPAYTESHSILIGGGTCSEDNTPCGEDAECSGTCETHPLPVVSVKLQNMPSLNNKSDPVWSGLFLGEGLKGPFGTDSYLILDGNLFSQNVGGGVMGGISRFWNYDTSENLSGFQVQMSNNRARGQNTYPDHTGNAPDLDVDGTWIGTSFITQQAVAPNDMTPERCFRLSGTLDNTELDCVTSLHASMNAPRGSRWVVGRISLFPFPALPINTDVACDVEAVLDTDFNGSIDQVSTNPVLYGSPGCDLAPESCSAYAGLIWNPNGDAFEDTLGFRVSAPTDPNRCTAPPCVCDQFSARMVYELLPDNR